MKSRLASTIAAAMLVAGCATNPVPKNELVGTWRLVSFEMELQGTGERIAPMGKSPAGYLSFMADGRTAVVITAEGRKPGTSEPERAGLYSSLVAYTGVYRIEADKWITKVDASANPAWVGTDQPRTFRITGTRMTEATPWFPRADKAMVRVNNVWERVAQP